MKNYTIEISEGCTAFATIVNGKNLNDMTKEEELEALNYVLEKLKESYFNGQTSLNDIVKLFQYDDYEYDPNTCETCGDNFSKMTWKL